VLAERGDDGRAVVEVQPGELVQLLIAQPRFAPKNRK
jgi:hypothetical protein